MVEPKLLSFIGRSEGNKVLAFIPRLKHLGFPAHFGKNLRNNHLETPENEIEIIYRGVG